VGLVPPYGTIIYIIHSDFPSTKRALYWKSPVMLPHSAEARVFERTTRRARRSHTNLPMDSSRLKFRRKKKGGEPGLLASLLFPFRGIRLA
jgi:hypothetical protein